MLHTLLLAAVVLSQNRKSYVRIGTPNQEPGALNLGRPFPQTEGVTRNGVPVFDTRYKEGKVWDWPDYYLRHAYTMSITIPNSGEVPKDGLIEFFCGDNGPCDLAVFLYECYPCGNENGGLPKYLATYDPPFTRTRCAPTFTLRDGGAKQRMSAYVATAEPGQTVVFRMPEEVHFVLFGISDGQGSGCNDLQRLRCINTAGHCTYNAVADKCEYTKCMQKGPGGCNPRTCVREEAARALS